MKTKNILTLVALSIALISCNQSTKKSITKNNQNIDELAFAKIEITQQDGYSLMKNNCYVCHNPNTASHDDILAPPFKAVKMHYTREYDTKEDFVNAMVNWVQNPEEDKALMFGAVKRFKVMPKLLLPTEDIEKIATYIYENDVEEPEWMKDHMKEMHGKGKGKGQGKGQGMGKGMKHN